MIRRAHVIAFSKGFKPPVCTAEDLFVMKVFASRPKDWLDAESIAIRQEGKLDRHYIIKQLILLCDLRGTPESVERAKKLLGLR